ncbi:MAG: hypothetical protein IPH75_08130 [bacterium]|nr:hypothetical protein [bacterium]
MTYIDKARAKLVELNDPRLPDEEVRERIAILMAQETGRAIWSGVQYAHQMDRRQAAQH